MITEKKSTSKNRTPQFKIDEPRFRSTDEFDEKRKTIREKVKAMRVHYVVKDLPMY